MENKKEIYRTGLMIGVLTFWLNIICMPIETLILGGVSLCLNILNRKNYRVKAGIVCTLLGMVLSVGYLLFEITMKQKLPGSQKSADFPYQALKCFLNLTDSLCGNYRSFPAKCF